MAEFLELGYSKEQLKNIVGRRRKGLVIAKRELGIDVKLETRENKLIIDKKATKLNDFELVSIFDALAMGFNAREALLLRNPDWLFEKINLKSFVRPSRLKEVRARLIGKAGKIKRAIQELTDCYISILNNDIGIIGREENIKVAKRAIERLITGRKHGSVLARLEREASQIEAKKELTEKQLKEIKE
ncbi:MAG: KH domain-containing protein [Candidatus Pacearchaeota archaeon]